MRPINEDSEIRRACRGGGKFHRTKNIDTHYIYVNDMVEGTSSYSSLFEDDEKMKEIKVEEGCKSLQFIGLISGPDAGVGNKIQ